MNRHAFSLLELVVVLVLISVLAVVALPRFGASTIRATGQSAAQRIAADIAWIQAEAVRQQAELIIDFRVALNRIRMGNSGKVMDPEHPGQNYVLKLDERMPGVSLVGADFGGDQLLEFTEWGVPKDGGTVVIAAGDRQWTITVEADTGRVQISE